MSDRWQEAMGVWQSGRLVVNGQVGRVNQHKQQHQHEQDRVNAIVVVSLPSCSVRWIGWEGVNTQHEQRHGIRGHAGRGRGGTCGDNQTSLRDRLGSGGKE